MHCDNAFSKCQLCGISVTYQMDTALQVWFSYWCGFANKETAIGKVKLQACCWNPNSTSKPSI